MHLADYLEKTRRERTGRIVALNGKMNGTNSTAYYLPSLGFSIGMVLFNCVCIIVGVTGNVGVIVYNIFMNHSKTPTTYFVVNLEISDTIVCLTFFPLSLVKNISILGNIKNNLKLICEFSMVSSCASIALSIANLLAITGDRYSYVHHKTIEIPNDYDFEKNSHITIR